MMDKKDAIDYLLYMKHNVLANSPYDVALDTAIEALKETAKQPKTNGDRIRNLTDEELRDFLDKITDCCFSNNDCDNCPMKYSDEPYYRCNIEAWLKQEASENGKD